MGSGKRSQSVCMVVPGGILSAVAATLATPTVGVSSVCRPVDLRTAEENSFRAECQPQTTYSSADRGPTFVYTECNCCEHFTLKKLLRSNNNKQKAPRESNLRQPPSWILSESYFSFHAEMSSDNLQCRNVSNEYRPIDLKPPPRLRAIIYTSLFRQPAAQAKNRKIRENQQIFSTAVLTHDLSEVNSENRRRCRTPVTIIS